MTASFHRLLAVVTLALVVLLTLAPATMASTQLLASEEVQEEPAPTDEGPSGAFIDAPAEEDASVDQAWTYRFLVPTALVLIAIVIAGTVVMYFVRVVRTRYTTVG